jgi:hypothetical protein
LGKRALLLRRQIGEHLLGHRQVLGRDHLEDLGVDARRAAGTSPRPGCATGATPPASAKSARHAARLTGLTGCAWLSRLSRARRAAASSASVPAEHPQKPAETAEVAACRLLLGRGRLHRRRRLGVLPGAEVLLDEFALGGLVITGHR